MSGYVPASTGFTESAAAAGSGVVHSLEDTASECGQYPPQRLRYGRSNKASRQKSVSESGWNHVYTRPMGTIFPVGFFILITSEAKGVIIL